MIIYYTWSSHCCRSRIWYAWISCSLSWSGCETWHICSSSSSRTTSCWWSTRDCFSPCPGRICKIMMMTLNFSKLMYGIKCNQTHLTRFTKKLMPCFCLNLLAVHVLKGKCLPFIWYSLPYYFCLSKYVR